MCPKLPGGPIYSIYFSDKSLPCHPTTVRFTSTARRGASGRWRLSCVMYVCLLATIMVCTVFDVCIYCSLQHGQRVTGMDWAAKSNQLVTCAAVSQPGTEYSEICLELSRDHLSIKTTQLGPIKLVCYRDCLYFLWARGSHYTQVSLYIVSHVSPVCLVVIPNSAHHTFDGCYLILSLPPSLCRIVMPMCGPTMAASGSRPL